MADFVNDDDGISRQHPPLELLNKRYLLTLQNQEFDNIKDELINEVTEKNMLPFYIFLCDQFKWEKNQDLVSKMEQENNKIIEELDNKIEDAKENLGETEIVDALLEKADYFCKIGDKKQTESSYAIASDKAVGFGQRLDIVFTLIRTGLFFSDHDLVSRNVKKAKSLIESEADWDRKNRLKVYEGVYLMSIRKFKEASDLLLDTLSTFNATELFSYPQFIKYSILTSIVSLDRVTLKKNVIDAPEIISVIADSPILSQLLQSIYDSEYSQFLKALIDVVDEIKADVYFGPHVRFFSRELRIKAYSQMLESYKSVQLDSMAKQFGISSDLLDRELSRFIALGRLNCKIDKVAGIVETNRPDAKNSLYQNTIKQGDLLLNRVQKLKSMVY